MKANGLRQIEADGKKSGADDPYGPRCTGHILDCGILSNVSFTAFGNRKTPSEAKTKHIRHTVGGGGW